jgi:phosphoribosylformylglycinamidine synthase
MASDSFAESGPESKATSKTPSKTPSKTTVQVGDPFAEKLLMEATLEVLEKNLVVGIQDMGAAGLTSSSFEMAGRAGNGIYLNLDLVPTRAKKMSAYEIMLSESQERMLMVVERAKWGALKEVLAKWQLPHAIIGEVTATGRMQIEAENILEVDLPVAPLTDLAPVYDRPIAKPAVRTKKSDRIDQLRKILMLDMEKTKNIFFGVLQDSGSKAPIFEQFDRHIGTRSVLGSDHGGAAIMWIRSEETGQRPFLGVALSAGCNERRVKNTPKIGAAEAVLKCAREMAAAGGVPLAITDCLNFGSPEDSLVMRELSDSVDGITEACRHLDVPVVSGNVSLYNSTDGASIHPTPMIGMVGRVNDIRKVTRAVVADEEHLVLSLITPTESLDDESALAASLAATKYGISSIEGAIAAIDWETEIMTINALHKLRDSGCLQSARAVGEGGAGLVALKMLEPIFDNIQSLKYLIQNGVDFFGEGGSRYLVVIPASLREKASKIINEHRLHLVDVAEVSCMRKNKHQEKSKSQMGKVQTYFGDFLLNDLRQIYENQS